MENWPQDYSNFILKPTYLDKFHQSLQHQLIFQASTGSWLYRSTALPHELDQAIYYHLQLLSS